MTDTQTSKVINFLSGQKHGVIATVTAQHKPEAALVGIAFTEKVEIIFDTLNTTRKYSNLLQNKNIAVVIGEKEITVQYEGTAEELTDEEELMKYKEIYFAAFPDGREREKWQGITYFVIRPLWLRYSDFNSLPPEIFELKF